MRTKYKIGTIGEFQGWAILTNRGIIRMDKFGIWFFGATATVVLFVFRQDAIKGAKKIKQERPDLVQWTKTIPVHYVENYE